MTETPMTSGYNNVNGAVPVRAPERYEDAGARLVNCGADFRGGKEMDPDILNFVRGARALHPVASLVLSLPSTCAPPAYRGRPEGFVGAALFPAPDTEGFVIGISTSVNCGYPVL